AATAVVLGSLFLLARISGNPEKFADWYIAIQSVNVALVLVLAGMLARRVYRLVRDYRHKLPGSPLAVGSVGVFCGLVIAPLLVIYGFSLYALERSIDSWFKGGTGPELVEAVAKFRMALEPREQEMERRTDKLAEALAGKPTAILASM